MKTYRYTQMDFDLIIIGAGPGGYVAAIKAAQLGLKTALVEKSALGGTCLNWGCIPSKALLKSSEVYQTIKNAEAFGISVKDVSFDIKKMVARSRTVVAKLEKGIQGLMKYHKVTVISGHARFKNSNTIEVEGKSYEAAHFIIATGAKPRMLEGVEASKRIWTSKEAMLCETLPKTLLIVGSGVIGIEYASFFAALGVKVTVVDIMERILGQEDLEIATLAQKSFEARGVTFQLKDSVQKMEETKTHVDVHFAKGGEAHFDAVIMAIGVIPNTQDLGLENTKVQMEKSIIQTNEYAQTAEPHIYAIGDVTNPPWLAHKASHEGILAVQHIKGRKVKPIQKARIPSCIYSSPQIASIGLREEDIKDHKVQIGRFPFAASGKALAVGETEGLIKVIFDEKTGELLGAHMIGENVTELISQIAIAMELETTQEELMNVIFPHPTLSEMIQEAVQELGVRS